MLKPSLQLRIGQQLTMTPQLQQAIRLLQLPALELQAHIRELLESNVMLEPEEEGDLADLASAEPVEAPEPEVAALTAPAAADQDTDKQSDTGGNRQGLVGILPDGRVSFS